MSTINPIRLFFPTSKSSDIPQLQIDIKKMVDAADANTERQLRHDLDSMLEEIEKHGIKSIHAHAVSPHNDAWFVFVDVMHGKLALYAFTDQEDGIHIYHANRQETAFPLFALLSNGLKIAKTL
jgi:hypothetical protein